MIKQIRALRDKYLPVLILLLLTIVTQAQVKQNYPQYGGKWKRIQTDSAIKIPMVSVGIKDANAGLDSAQIMYNPADSSVKVYTGNQWIDAVRSSGTGVDSIWRTPGIDSIYYSKNGINRAVKDSTGGSTNSNIGSGYRLAETGTNNIKTLFAGYGIIKDSTSNANGITTKLDTTTVFPAVRGTIPAHTLQQVYMASSGNQLTSYHNINMGSQYIDYSNVGTVMFATAGGTELEISNDFIDMYTQTGTAPNRLKAFHNVSTNEIRTYLSNNSGDFISDLPYIKMFRNDSSLTINSKKVIIDGGILNIDNTQVGIGTSSPNASALLDVTSTTQGAVLPRMNTTQMNSISSPVAGLMVYNSDSASYCYYNGSVWLKMGSGTGGATSPGGSTKQFQYNNAGAFAGSSMLTQETDQILITGNSAASTPPFEVNAHEDLTAEIVNVKQSGTKKFSFHSNGSIELTDVSAPSTPASGYGAVYVRSDSLRFKNDGGTEFTLGSGGGASALDDLTDVTITNIQKGQMIYYDSVTSKYINGYDNDRRSSAMEYFEDFLYFTGSNAGVHYNARNSGASSFSTISSWDYAETSIKRPGMWALITGTASNGYGMVDMFTNNAYAMRIRAGYYNGETEWKTSFALHNESNSTDEYVAYMGYMSSGISVEPTDGVYFKYDRANYGDTLVLVAANGGTRSQVTTNVLISSNAVDKWLSLRLVVNDDATSMRAYYKTETGNWTEITAVTGTYPIASNFPSGSNTVMVSQSIIRKTAGTATRAMLLDYIGIRQEIPKGR